MQYKVVFPLIVLALLGLFFLGDGITGLVIFQGCCYPPNCAADKLCPGAQLPLQSGNLNMQGVLLGGILVCLAIAGYLIIYRK